MHILFIFGIIAAIVTLVKEALEKPAPKGQRFDWDAYWKDVENGMDSMEQVRKRQRGGYLTTDPLPNTKSQTNAEVPGFGNGKENNGKYPEIYEVQSGSALFSKRG